MERMHTGSGVAPGHGGAPAKSSKVQARFVDQERGARLLYVNDEADWKVLHEERAPVQCPEPGCSVRLHACQNKQGTRWLREPKGLSCSHYWAPPSAGGGGVEGERHLFIKSRLARIVTGLGMTPVIEHVPTGADVYVVEKLLVLEYQQWNTSWQERIEKRRRAGASTIWFVPETPESAGIQRHFKDAMRRHPLVRLRVADKDDPTLTLTPWDHQDQRIRARLYVQGAFLKRNRGTGQLFISKRAESLNAWSFLRNVCVGRMKWYPQGSPAIPNGSITGAWGWVKDVETRQPGIRTTPTRIQPPTTPPPAVNHKVIEPPSTPPVPLPAEEVPEPPPAVLTGPDEPGADETTAQETATAREAEALNDRPASPSPVVKPNWFRRLLDYLFKP